MKVVKVKGGGTIEVHAEIDEDTVSKEIAESLVSQGWATKAKADEAKAKKDAEAKAKADEGK